MHLALKQVGISAIQCSQLLSIMAFRLPINKYFTSLLKHLDDKNLWLDYGGSWYMFALLLIVIYVITLHYITALISALSSVLLLWSWCILWFTVCLHFLEFWYSKTSTLNTACKYRWLGGVHSKLFWDIVLKCIISLNKTDNIKLSSKECSL